MGLRAGVCGGFLVFWSSLCQSKHQNLGVLKTTLSDSCSQSCGLMGSAWWSLLASPTQLESGSWGRVMRASSFAHSWAGVGRGLRRPFLLWPLQTGAESSQTGCLRGLGTPPWPLGFPRSVDPESLGRNLKAAIVCSFHCDCWDVFQVFHGGGKTSCHAWSVPYS